jgi:hypothetical protein
MTTREQNICEIESSWCDQITKLVDEDKIQDADALFSEYVIEGVDPFDDEWLFISFYKDVH